jgi:hypothetical protein
MQELGVVKPDAFCTELVKCLADYCENVRDMEGAGGLRLVKSFKRKFKDIEYDLEASSSQMAEGEDGEGTGGEDPADADAPAVASAGVVAQAGAPAGADATAGAQGAKGPPPSPDAKAKKAWKGKGGRAP